MYMNQELKLNIINTVKCCFLFQYGRYIWDFVYVDDSGDIIIKYSADESIPLGDTEDAIVFINEILDGSAVVTHIEFTMMTKCMLYSEFEKASQRLWFETNEEYNYNVDDDYSFLFDHSINYIVKVRLRYCE